MGSFTTKLHIPTLILPPDFIRVLNERYPDCEPLGPKDTVDDLTVEVTYGEGWYQPARFGGPPDSWAPDDGESPTILSVMVQDESYPAFEVCKSLSEKLIDKLEGEAWAHQERIAREAPDFEPPDPFD